MPALGQLTGGLPMLLCTGFNSSLDAEALRRLGIGQVLAKPVRELMQALAQALPVQDGP